MTKIAPSKSLSGLLVIYLEFYLQVLRMKKLVLAATISASLLSLSANAADMTTSLTDYFSENGVQTTVENYPTLETARQMVKNQDIIGINKIRHKRVLTPTDDQPVVRMNRDTFYSFATVDVSEGAVITMPEIPEGKYMSVEVITQDHRIQPMMYGAGKFNLTTHIGDHVALVIRLDATFSKEEVRKYQDQMYITAKSDNFFKAVHVNKETFHKVEKSLKAKMPKILKEGGAEATFGMFTAPTDSSKELFNKERYSVGAAIGWGGAQLVDNVYEVSGNYPMDTCHQMTFEDPKDKAFWSVTVYNKQGFMFGELANVNSKKAEVNADGTYTVSFGCGADAINNIPTKMLQVYLT